MAKRGYAEGGYIPGVTEVGNIDLHNRPVVRNPDNSISTVRSITIGSDGGHYVIPTVVGNQVVSNDEAVDNFRKTGQHLGKFDTLDNAEAYSQQLHEDQAKEYGHARGGKVSGVMKRVAKDVVDYGKGMKAAHCGICRFFMAPDECSKVVGRISPQAWCKLWRKK